MMSGLEGVMKEKLELKLAIDAFAYEMQRKMCKCAEEGKRGWRDFPRALTRMEEELDEYHQSGDPAELVDAANFLLMEWFRKVKP